MTDFLSPRSRHRLSERYHELLRECGELHDAKQADYGEDDDPFANVRASDDFGVPGWIGAALRGNDKMKRIQKAARQRLSGKKIKLKNESMENSLLDLAVYALIALVLFEEEQGLLPVESAEQFVWDVDDMPISMARCNALFEVMNKIRIATCSDPTSMRVSPEIVEPSHRVSFFRHRGPVTLWGIPVSFDASLGLDEIEMSHPMSGTGRTGAETTTRFSFSDFLTETT